MNFKLLDELINKYDTIIIHGHQNPDGDCFGSQFGLKGIIQENYKNKKVYVVGPVCGFVSFLGTPDIIEDSLYKDALTISVDTGDDNRLSDSRFFNAKETIKIDHHIPVKQFANHNFVDEHIPACTLVISKFALELNLKITKEAAFALYTGLVTDTGRFRHGITPETFEIAGKLVELGVSPKELDNLISKESLEVLKFKGHILNNFKITSNGVCYATITQKDLVDYNISYEEATNQLGLISTLESCPVWLFIIEDTKGVRCRIRSRGPRVDEVANKYNGGGHMFASGALVKDFIEAENVINDLDQLLKEFKDKPNA